VFESIALVVFTLVISGAEAQNECRTFGETYANGKELCERLWDGAFTYVSKFDEDYELAYTMWFFEDGNPNDEVTEKRIEQNKTKWNYTNTNECHLDYFHYEYPQILNGMTECSPWAENACCKKETVASPQVLNDAYGAGFNWNRCGALSQECERFLVQEACLYECDANSGLYRKHHTFVDDPELSWQIEGMPIKGEYCDAFYQACKDQPFYYCGDADGDPGNWFLCAKEIEEEEEKGDGRDLSGGAIAVITILAIAACCLVSCSFIMVKREREGKPIFKPLEPSDTESGPKQESSSSFEVAQT